MSEHRAFLDRLHGRLAELERQIANLRAGGDAATTRRVADLEAAAGVARGRLHELRRAGAELTADMTRSLGEQVERLSAKVGEALAAR